MDPTNYLPWATAEPTVNGNPQHSPHEEVRERLLEGLAWERLVLFWGSVFLLNRHWWIQHWVSEKLSVHRRHHRNQPHRWVCSAALLPWPGSSPSPPVLWGDALSNSFWFFYSYVFFTWDPLGSEHILIHSKVIIFNNIFKLNFFIPVFTISKVTSSGYGRCGFIWSKLPMRLFSWLVPSLLRSAFSSNLTFRGLLLTFQNRNRTPGNSTTSPCFLDQTWASVYLFTAFLFLAHWNISSVKARTSFILLTAGPLGPRLDINHLLNTSMNI